MAEAVFRSFFPGRVRLFGKTGSHSRESRATNAAGKNALSQRRNKAERNCRHTQGTQQIKSRSCRTVFLCGSFCFSVLICTPILGVQYWGYISFLLISQSVLRAAFPVLSICLAIMLSSSCVIVAQFATR